MPKMRCISQNSKSKTFYRIICPKSKPFLRRTHINAHARHLAEARRPANAPLKPQRRPKYQLTAIPNTDRRAPADAIR